MRRLNGTCMAVFAVALGVALLAQPAGVLAQTTLKPEALVGKYEGTATGPDGSEMALRVELRLEKGVVVGGGETAQGPFTITGATVTGDKVVMNMDFNGMPGTLSGAMKGDRVEGTWTLGDMSGAYSLVKAAATPAAASSATAAPAAPSAKPAGAGVNAADPISGQWDGVTGQGEQTVAFVLNVKVDGEKVTGDISSEQGGAALSSGVWKDGTLTMTFDFGGMTATMVGAMKEGKLIGTLDIGGQMQMAWAAVKK
jgi:hypothetical protein